MIDIDEIRRANLRRIESDHAGPAEVAVKLGMSISQFINLRDGARDSRTGKRRGMRKDTARRIEAAAGKPPGWLDLPPDSAPPPPPAPAPQPAEPSVAALLERLRAELARQPEAVKRATADLVGEYLTTPDEDNGQAVADAILRILGARP